MADSRLKYYGALLECFVTYPIFADDFDLLVEKGYLEQKSPDKCNWLKSKISLAEYFKWISDGVKGTTGGKWKAIAKAFGEDKICLERLSRRYGPRSDRSVSKDFEKLWWDYLPPYRERLNRIRREKTAFYKLKTLINNVDEKKSDEIHVNLKKMQKILSKIVDKK